MKHVLALSIVAAAASAASAQTLISSDWEAPWVIGNIAGAPNAGMGWVNFNNAGGHTVRASGFSVSGTPVTAASGSQFHVSAPSTSTTTVFGRYTWGDLTPAWTARTPGNNVIEYSEDWFLPSTSNAAGRHGVEGYGDTGAGPGSALLNGFFINPATGGVHLEDFAGNASGVLATLPRNQWVNIRSLYDTVTGDFDLYVGGTWVGHTAGQVAPIGVNDYDYFNQNSFDGITPVAGSNVASDNYGVRAVPTPGSAALLGVGVLAAARRRRA